MIGAREFFLLDGATGSELDRRGVDASLPLWSARALLEAPEVLAQIHRDYLEAGADAITTNTFRTHRRTLAKVGLGGRARELTERAIEIARRVRDEVRPDALVLGSVAPLEDCYEPQRAPDAATCRREHREMTVHLIDAGVDRILIETMNNLTEARAAIEAARAIASERWMVSFCVKSDGPPGVLLSGESLELILPELTDAIAVGVNCIAAPVMRENVQFLRERARERVAVMAYANVGRADPVRGWINSDAIAPQRYAEYARTWLDAGATMIGGCCGTTPATIAALNSLRAPQAATEPRY